MTGTKIIKLRLDEEGVGQKLPKLKEGTLETCRRVFKAHDPRMGHLGYDDMIEATKDLDVDSEQLENILRDLHVNHSQDRKFGEIAGLLLSALVHNSRQDEFEIETPVPLDYVGHRLSKGKTLTIKGDVGDNAGDGMDGGVMNINGNAGSAVGNSMCDGTINVSGYSGNYTGSNMHSGRINVKKETGGMTGAYMGGGIIACKGKVLDLAHTIYGGAIYSRGKQIWP
ncbi:MAG: hypothetical protein V1921_06310 [Candidatus Altiarchaeota archaeon]